MTRVVLADDAGVDEACRVLARGGLVAFPTETVYGLGARALDGAHVARVFAAKGRPADNPVIVHVADATWLARVAVRVPEASRRLAAACWPGPLTLVLPKHPSIPDVVTAGGPTVAVRAPAHPAARALLTRLDAPLAAPSANRSGTLSPTTADEVVRSLGDAVDLVLDGGPCGVGIESTVVSADDVLRVLRPGSLAPSRLASIAGVPVAPAGGAEAASPGTRHKHYSPGVPVVVVEPSLVASTAARLGAVTLTRSMAGDVRLPDDAAGYAQGLFAALRLLAARGVPIVVEGPPADEAWDGVRDRLGRAAE